MAAPVELRPLVRIQTHDRLREQPHTDELSQFSRLTPKVEDVEGQPTS